MDTLQPDADAQWRTFERALDAWVDKNMCGTSRIDREDLAHALTWLVEESGSGRPLHLDLREQSISACAGVTAAVAGALAAALRGAPVLRLVLPPYLYSLPFFVKALGHLDGLAVEAPEFAGGKLEAQALCGRNQSLWVSGLESLRVLQVPRGVWINAQPGHVVVAIVKPQRWAYRPSIRG